MILVNLIIAGILWFGCIVPFTAAVDYNRYQRLASTQEWKAAKQSLLLALRKSPDSTKYAFSAFNLAMSQGKWVEASEHIERALRRFNGDITLYGIFYNKGALKFRTGDLMGARAALRKAVYCYPDFAPSRRMLTEVEKVIEENDQVLIKYK